MSRLSRDLSPQQWRIAALMAEGINQASVAERLGITRNTLRGQLYGRFGYEGLYDRLGVHSDNEVIAWWFTEGCHRYPVDLAE